jgi:hypothetical protein
MNVLLLLCCRPLPFRGSGIALLNVSSAADPEIGMEPIEHQRNAATSSKKLLWAIKAEAPPSDTARDCKITATNHSNK